MPNCSEANADDSGPCLNVSEEISASISGSFGESATVGITTQPTHGICIKLSGDVPGYSWSPSPCFDSVASPSVGSCVVIDRFDNDTIKELPCRDALYLQPSGAESLFSVADDMGERCGGAGNFQTFAYGGAANVEGARWSEFGPARQTCNISFNGPRPDGLFGPTWAKVTVQAGIAETGGGRRGSIRSVTSEILVPVVGDLRDELIDVGVLATGSTFTEDDVLFVDTTVFVTNFGSEALSNHPVTINVPTDVIFIEGDFSDCTPNNGEQVPFTSNVMTCFFDLAATGDSFGSDTKSVDLSLRVTNTTELNGVGRIIARTNLADDQNLDNNEDAFRFDAPTQPGSVTTTVDALNALEAVFDYQISSDLLFNMQCDAYRDDIFARFELLRIDRPDLFDTISYGRITSGGYNVLTQLPDPTSSTGHVGVVVYAKGTDYRETGVIIHGTPTWSPVDLDIESRLGLNPIGDHVTEFGFFEQIVGYGTQGHGQYYRTPVRNFPGQVRKEDTEACGFEGQYSDNVAEFPNPNNCANEQASAALCPVFPEATVVRTESPVNVRAINANGAVIETSEGTITFDPEEYPTVFAWDTPHDDGSFGWYIVLPEDDYQLELDGTGEGPYTVHSVTFDDGGEPLVSTLVNNTSTNQRDSFVLDTELSLVSSVIIDPTASGESRSGGGCSITGTAHSASLLPLLTLGSIGMLAWRRTRGRVRSPTTMH